MQPFQTTFSSYGFCHILWFKHRQISVYLSILPLWGLNCLFYGSITGSRVFLCVITHAWENRHSLASLLIFELFQCAIGKKSRAKQFTSPSALSISANNGELVLSASPKTLYMRQPCLCSPSVDTSHWKLAYAQECFMGLCMFRWNMYAPVRSAVLMYLSCSVRRRWAASQIICAAIAEGPFGELRSWKYCEK